MPRQGQPSMRAPMRVRRMISGRAKRGVPPQMRREKEALTLSWPGGYFGRRLRKGRAQAGMMMAILPASSFIRSLSSMSLS